MKNEIDLLINYPKSKRNLDERNNQKTESVRKVAREFGQEFFDGDRKFGYGGFIYHPRFWQPVIPTFRDYFKLNQNHSILDVGSGKGFMIYDFKQLIPGINVHGIDISKYAVDNTIEDMKPYVQVSDAKNLPFKDNSFDYVFSINTIHNLDKNECAIALKEIERVSRSGSFITVDAYRNDIEKERMFAWNLTAKTILSVEGWKYFFNECGYTGDYFWFLP